MERHLGVTRLGLGQLLAQHVGPAAAALPREALWGYVQGLLVALAAEGGALAGGQLAGPEAAALRQAFR